ncbi:hypothetical protein FKB36_13260 [Methanoculleus sp. Afa-1]|jgi:hypothetical protein|uniref:Uncharacterized protein n=1 Tax=Methanoculleus formosensis TaxID=2590886 RepID=A0A9E4ZLQ6_9EURY|nr:hypothetical protein [Methanoculleus sp. Afa-1]MCT8338417.1 hypothetical protein [Methanoculleus sp. Afa-1]PKL60977.1 MAG: hypothetical protein CVV31_13950 [Methanomicrobiales archaeon HGW-Methanomicrobiales-2]
MADDEAFLQQELEISPIVTGLHDTLSERDREVLRKTTECYGILKDLALYAEELNSESFLPPINEVRDAFDHLMRMYSVLFGLRDGDGEYIKENLDAVFRHVYRASFDYLDYIRIYQKDYIHRRLEGISQQTIVNLFPEYYREILPEIESCLEDIPLYKASKDIGKPDMETVERYHAKVLKLRDYCAQINRMAPVLIEAESNLRLEMEQREKKESEIRRAEAWKYLLFTIIGAIIGGIIGALVLAG